MINTPQRSQRTVLAPSPTSVSGSIPSNRVLSVVLDDNEDVEWTWTSTAEGTSYVSGYTIVTRENPASLNSNETPRGVVPAA